MDKRGLAARVGGGVLAVWLVLAWASGGPSAHAYGVSVREAAAGTLSTVRTVILAGRADLAGQLFNPYLSTVLEDATTAARTAQSNLAHGAPPDPDSQRMRDEVAPLLAQAVRGIGDVSLAVGARDDGGLAAALGRLTALTAELDAFLNGTS